MQQRKKIRFNCRHCGRTCAPQGFWKHLKESHRDKSLSYEKELEAHGFHREYRGRGWEQVAGPAPSQVGGTFNPAPNPAVVRALVPEGRLTISREALQLALSGLERVRGELEGHIADVKATLDPPVRRKKAYRVINSKWEEEPKEEITSRWSTNGANKKVWSNDPEGKYRHYKDTGEIMMNPRTGEPWIKPRASAASIAALAKARSVRWSPKVRKATK